MPNEGLLKYKNVKDADGFVPDLSGSTQASFAHYQLKLSTTPGRAIYEVGEVLLIFGLWLQVGRLIGRCIGLEELFNRGTVPYWVLL